MADKPAVLLRHPLTITAVSFLLTGVLGAFLSEYLNRQQQERDHFLQVTAARQVAVQGFAQTAYDRWIRANMLLSSLRRLAPLDELRSRKNAYDDSYARWGRDLQANMFMIRTAMESQEYTAFEGDVEFRLTPILKAMDTCLTKAYDIRLQGVDAGSVLQKCDIDSVSLNALNCMYAVTDQLFRVAVPEAPRTPFQRDSAQRAAEEDIRTKCVSS